MNDDIFSDFAIEKSARIDFGVTLEIVQVVARDVPVGDAAHATLFLTSKNALYLYVVGQDLLLADVRKIVSRMKLEAHTYVPPASSPDYFEVVGHEKFHEVFPSRQVVTDSDIEYYKTLAPYATGLVRISRVKGGEVFGLDVATSEWRKIAEYSYHSIKAS